MGKYKIFYFEDPKTGDLLIECPICKNLSREAIVEPVAVIVKKRDFENLKAKLSAINCLDSLKKLVISEKVLNKDDLVCIFHQRKNSKWWKDDTKEFKRWNYRILDLYKENKLTDTDFNNIDKNNLVFQFWRRLRAYRFVVDYFGFRINREWKDFVSVLQNIKIDIAEVEKDKNLIEIYVKRLAGKERVYRFRNYIFPLFFRYFYFGRHLFDDNEKLKRTFNFWYKGEKLEFSHKLDFYKAIFSNDAYFRNVTFQNVANFRKANFNADVYFRNSKFLNEVLFWHTEFNGVVYFTNCKFNGKSFFNNATFNDVAYFSNTDFRNKADFWNATFGGVTDFSEATFRNSAAFWSVKFYNVVVFHETTFSKKAYFNNAIFGDEIYLNNCLIASLDFNSIKLTERTYLEINYCKFLKINLKNFVNHTDSFLISNSQILEREDFEKKLKKFNLQLEGNNSSSKLLIDNCILNNLKFINCDFSGASQIDIKNSFVEDVIFNNMEWGDIREDRICPDMYKHSPKSARDIFRQIKHSLDKQADYINANWFYSLEMKAYEKYLQKRPWKDHFQEKLIFKTHKFISDFGQSWFRPLLLIVLSTITMLGFGISLNNRPCENILSMGMFNKVCDCIIPIFEFSFWFSYLVLFTIFYYIYLFFTAKTNGVNLQFFGNRYENIGFTKRLFNRTYIVINFKTLGIIAFFILMPVYIIASFYVKDGDIIKAIFDLLDNAAVTLNISNIFAIFTESEKTVTPVS